MFILQVTGASPQGEKTLQILQTRRCPNKDDSRLRQLLSWGEALDGGREGRLSPPPTQRWTTYHSINVTECQHVPGPVPAAGDRDEGPSLPSGSVGWAARERR